MRILILGEDAPGGLMASYARGFTEVGVDVQTYCLARAYASVLPAIRARVLRRIAERALVAAFNERVTADLDGTDADLVLVIKGHRLSAVTVDRLRETTGSPVVNFYPDDPFSVERSNRLVFGAQVLSTYDICFTFARHLMPDYERAGARAVHYLPFARDPVLHSPAPATLAPEFDVVFVGNLDDDRIRFLEPLASRYRVGVFGERTTDAVPRGSPLRRSTFGPAAYGPELARVLARGAISLNVMRRQNARSHNMRSFESPACGAFTLSQRTDELRTLFAEGEDIACYETVAELSDQVARWLDATTAREAVAAAGFQRVREDTYSRRACSILEKVGATAGALS